MATAKKTNTHVDAVIVGSGAAGALVAAKLAAKGKMRPPTVAANAAMVN